ncbi:hypothetical protein FGIG_06226 [Fasciola gigantica]|uniref:Apple domain-containing protein n=1 Tax=Fasciola gigantica TaxID=46835 RepID=A0A504YWJ1_FASGI|nr:hypothetical protein FGIG_06226 [Fasciola gigantica]
MYGTYLAIISFVAFAGIFPLLLTSVSICPKGFVDAGENVCMIRIDREAAYCDAHRICEHEGTKSGLRLFIPGYHAQKIPSLFRDIEIVFTSYSATLNRSNDPRAGWRVGDPGYANFVTTSDDTTIPWRIGLPVHVVQAIALYTGGYIWEGFEIQLTSTAVICEISHRPTGARVERFQMNWPYRLDYLFLKDDIPRGCFDNFFASTLIECAKSCKQRAECRSFYFNEQSRECLLSLFVDCLLPLYFVGRTASWVRFGRPDW